MSIQTVNITVYDENENPVSGFYVEVRRSSDSALVTSKSTDGSGTVSIASLPSDTYVVLGHKNEFRYQTQTITVVDASPADPQTFAVTGTNLAYTLPPDRPLCRLYGFLAQSVLRTLLRPPYPSVVVAEEPGFRVGAGTSFAALNQRSVPLQVRAALGGASWEVDLVQGSIVTVSIPILGYRKRIIAPKAISANIEDLQEVVGSEDIVSSS